LVIYYTIDETTDLKVQISIVAIGPINEKDFVSHSLFRKFSKWKTSLKKICQL